MRIISGVLAFGFPFFSFAQVGVTEAPVQPKDAYIQSILESVPPELRPLLKRNPASLTAEQRARLAPYIRVGASPTTLPKDAVNCFDYYRFGSVEVDVAPVRERADIGTPLAFAGKIKNSNAYPIVDGQVYAKIFYKSEDDAASVQVNGYPLVDFFLVRDGIAVGAESELPISFDWRVPQDAAAGEYEAAMFFTSARRYNLLGLSFTDDVVGNTARFFVDGGPDAKPVAFDKNSVTMNGVAYHFAAPPPRFARDEAVAIRVSVSNRGAAQKNVAVRWRTFAWDGLLDERMAEEKAEVITLRAGEERGVAYTPPVLNASATYVVAELHDGDAQSMINARFARVGIEEARINFPSINRYPLTRGEQNTIFSCVHSTGLPIVRGYSLTLLLADDRGKAIERYEYAGDITGAMMAVKKDFVPAKTYASFSLTATLRAGDRVVEEVTQRYSCEAIDPEACPSKFPAALVIIGAVALLIAAAYGMRKWNNRAGV